jgi:hypothetical protein
MALLVGVVTVSPSGCSRPCPDGAVGCATPVPNHLIVHFAKFPGLREADPQRLVFGLAITNHGSEGVWSTSCRLRVYNARGQLIGRDNHFRPGVPAGVRIDAGHTFKDAYSLLRLGPGGATRLDGRCNAVEWHGMVPI